MKNWQPHDIIILILTVTISILLMIVIIKPFITNNVMQPDSAKLLSAIITSIIAIISIYVGSKIKKY